MIYLLLAVQFLTRYPVRIAAGRELTARDLGKSTRWYPLVGLFAGADLMLLRWILQRFGALGQWPFACAALLLVYWVWSCDSLHLDGLADTADGLASRRSGEEMLEVMHDSRCGAFGVQATVLVLILKGAWLVSLPPRLWWAFPLPMLFSRLFAALCAQSRPYAGVPGSLSGALIGGTEASDGHWAVASAFLAFWGLAGAALTLGKTDVRGCLSALGVCLGALACGAIAVSAPRRRLGGISGDLIGFGIEVCEVTAAFGLLFAGL
jgi:adenosylcobinamide-GDP ribazoletransferase